MKTTTSVNLSNLYLPLLTRSSRCPATVLSILRYLIFDRILIGIFQSNSFGFQVVLLQNIYTVVEQLSGILTQAEAAKLLASLIDSLPKEPHPSIVKARMNLVLTTVRGPLFTEASSARAILLGTICRQLRLHLSQPLVMSLCTETLGHMMNFYRNMSMADDTSQVDNVWYRDVETIALATLGVLIQAVQLAQKTDSNVVIKFFLFNELEMDLMASLLGSFGRVPVERVGTAGPGPLRPIVVGAVGAKAT